jgi:hypothetical protein
MKADLSVTFFAIGIGFTGVALAQDVQGMGSGIKCKAY